MANNDPLTEEELVWGRNLRAIWDAKARDLRLTQDKAAEIYGCTQGNISQYLTKKIPLNTDAIRKFAAMLHVEPGRINPKFSDVFSEEEQQEVMARDIMPQVYRMSPKEAAKFLGQVENYVDSLLKPSDDGK